MHPSFDQHFRTRSLVDSDVRLRRHRSGPLVIDYFALSVLRETSGRRGVLFNSITVHYTISPLYYRVRGSSKTGAYLLVVSGWCTC